METVKKGDLKVASYVIAKEDRKRMRARQGSRKEDRAGTKPVPTRKSVKEVPTG